MTINVDNVRATLDSVRQHGPEHLDMLSWFSNDEHEGGDLCDAPSIDINACGTTACLAGHTTLAARNNGVDVSDWFWWNAADWLGIPRDDAEGLFMTSFHLPWPGIQRKRQLKLDGFLPATAEWMAAIELLEQLIKDVEETP